MQRQLRKRRFFLPNLRIGTRLPLPKTPRRDLPPLSQHREAPPRPPNPPLPHSLGFAMHAMQRRRETSAQSKSRSLVEKRPGMAISTRSSVTSPRPKVFHPLFVSSSRLRQHRSIQRKDFFA